MAWLHFTSACGLCLSSCTRASRVLGTSQAVQYGADCWPCSNLRVRSTEGGSPMQGASSGPPPRSNAQPHANIFIMGCYLFPIFSVPKMRGIYVDEHGHLRPQSQRDCCFEQMRYDKVLKDQAVLVSDWASTDKSRLRALFSGPQSLVHEVGY